MTKMIPLAVVCCFSLAAALRADAPPAESPVDPAVEKLVEQLGDYDYRVRDQASIALKSAGASAIPALRKALTHPDAEVRRRVNELLPAVETAALLAAKRVTFKIADKPVKDAFDELIRQTGYHIEYNVNDPSKLYSFDFQDASFWEALDKISRTTGLAIQQGYGDDHVRLYQQDGYAPYVHYQGAVRFTANSFNQYRNIDLSLIGRGGPQPPHSESLTLTFSVFVEPKLALLGIGEAHLDAAYDNLKNSLLVPENPNEFLNNRRYTSGKYGNGNRMYNMQSQVNLQRPSDQAATLKQVRGTLPVTLLVEQKDEVVTNKFLAAKGTKIKIGTTQFNIDDVTEQPGKQYQLRMSVSEDMQDDPNDYSWMNSLYQRIELQDDKGVQYQIFGSQWNNNSPNHVEMTLTYAAQGGVKADPPAKLIYHTWKTRQETIPFEFKDLPLP